MASTAKDRTKKPDKGDKPKRGTSSTPDRQRPSQPVQPSRPPPSPRPPSTTDSGRDGERSRKPSSSTAIQRAREQRRENEREIERLRQWSAWSPEPRTDDREYGPRTPPSTTRASRPSPHERRAFVPLIVDSRGEQRTPSAPPDILRGPYEPRFTPPRLALQKDVTGQGPVSTATPSLSASSVASGQTVATRPMQTPPDILRGPYLSPEEKIAERSRRIREDASLGAMGIGSLLDTLHSPPDEPTTKWLEQNRFHSPQEAIEWFSPDAAKQRRIQQPPPLGSIAAFVARTDRRFGLAFDQGPQGQAAREGQAARTPPPAPDTLQYTWPQYLLSTWRNWRADDPTNDVGRAVAGTGALMGTMFDLGFQVPTKTVLASPLNPVSIEPGNTDFKQSPFAIGANEPIPDSSLYKQYDPEKGVTYVGGNSPAIIYGNAKDVAIQYVKDFFKGEDFFGAIYRYYSDPDFRDEMNTKALEKAYEAWLQGVLESKRAAAYGQTLPNEERWDYMAAQDMESSGDFPESAMLIAGHKDEIKRLYAEADRYKQQAAIATDQRIKAEAAYASANYAAQARQLENMYIADLAESNMTPSDMAIEIFEGIFGDPTNLIPFGYADEIADAARAFTRSADDVVSELNLAAQQSDEILNALMPEGMSPVASASAQQPLPIPTPPRRVAGDIRKVAGRPAKEAKSVGPAALNPFGATRESLSLDAKASAYTIINTVTSFGDTPIAVADARKIITALIDDPASLVRGIPASEFISPQIKEFAQADGKVYWPAGLGDVLKKNHIFFQNARDDILNSPFLLAPDTTPLARGGFSGYVNEVIYDSSRRLYGVVNVPSDVPMGAHSVKAAPVKDNPNVMVLEYRDVNGTLIGKSQPVSADQATALAQQYQKALRASEHGVITRALSKPMQIQKRIMTDLGLIFNPAFIIRNAANGMGVMFSDDLMSFTKVKDIDDMMRRFGVDALRIAEGRAGGIQSGLEGAQRVGRGNAYTRFRDKVAQKGAFGRSEVPLPGGAFAIGEQNFYTKIWGEAFKRFWNQEWPKTVNAYFVKPLLDAGLPPEIVNTLGAKLTERGLQGDKSALSLLLRGDINAASVKPALTQLLNNRFIIDKMPMPLRVQLAKAVDAYNGDMTDVLAVFTEWERQSAVNLAAVGQATPGSGMNTVNEMAQDIAAQYQEAVQNGISAGLSPQEAQAVAQVQVQTYQDSYQFIRAFLNDVSNTQPSDIAATISINTWMDLYDARWELRAYHNETYDEVFTRNAAPNITSAESAANWQWKVQQDLAANQRYRDKVRKIVADAREALSRSDFPDIEAVRTRWQNMYQEYAAHAASDYADRFIEVGKSDDPAFLRVLTAHQNYIDEAYIALFDAVARKPTPESFDIMIEANAFADQQLAIAESKRLAARAHAHELTDGVPYSAETEAIWDEARRIRNQAYREAADAARQKFEAAYEIIVGRAPPPSRVGLPPDVPTPSPSTPPIANGPAIWRHNDTDEPVNITGVLGEANGERYYSIEGSTTGIPESQLISAESAPSLPSEEEINAASALKLGMPTDMQPVDMATLKKGDQVYIRQGNGRYQLVTIDKVNRSRKGANKGEVTSFIADRMTYKPSRIQGRPAATAQPREPFYFPGEQEGYPAANAPQSAPETATSPAQGSSLGRGSSPIVDKSARPEIPEIRRVAQAAGVDSSRGYDNRLLNSINYHIRNGDIDVLGGKERKIGKLSDLTPEDAQKVIDFYASGRYAESKAAQKAATTAPAAPNAPNAPAAPTTSALVGNRTDAFDTSDASARPYDVQYEVVEYSDLITSDKPGFPPELQPRDRTQAASQLQVDRIANNLRPLLLLEDTKRIDGGTPIIGPGNIVESGNGRMMGYGRATPQAQAAYKQALIEAAQKYGIDPAAIERMQNPILVRRRLSGNAVDFVQQANARTTLGMNSLETSANLANKIKPSDLAPLLDLNDAPIAEQLSKARAQEAVSRILANVLENDKAGLIGPNGELTKAGLAYVRDAILSIIIKDDALRANYISDIDTEFRNIGRGIEIAAAKLAYLEKSNPELALGDILSEAALNLIRMKEEGKSLDTFLNQGALLSEMEVSPEVEVLMRFLSENNLKAPHIGAMLNNYADAAIKQIGQGGLLSGELPTVLEMLQGAARQAGRGTQGKMIFSFPGNIFYGGEKGIKKLIADWKANRARNARIPSQVEVAHPFIDEFQSIESARKEILRVLNGQIPNVANTLTQEQRLAALDALNKALRQWDNNLLAAQWFSTKAGDFGMLNYGDQRNFDVLLSMVMPYHYFWSRSAGNWLKRMATRPALFNIYWEIEQQLKDAQRQNEIWNEGDPARVGEMIPVFGLNFMGNPLNLVFPNNSYLANEYVDPDTANNDWERWWLRAQQYTPIGGPAYNTAIAGALDYIYPRPPGAMPRWKEEATIGNLGPIPRLASYGWQGVTGDIANPALSGNAYMHGIVGRYLAADKSITPEQYRWALDYGMRLMTGYPPLPEEPPYAKELWDKAAKQAGMDYLTTKALSTLTGVPWGVMAPGEREMIQAKNLRRGLGAQGGENPYGSHAAQVEFDRLTNEAALRGAQYPTLYQKIDAPLPTEYSQNRPGVQAVRNQQQAELDALEARYKQATDDYYEAHISEKTADIQKGLDALAAQYNKDKDAIKAKYASTLREEPEYPTAYKNYSQDEVDAAAYNKAKFAAIEQAGEYPDKLPKGSTNAQYEQRDAQIKAIEQKQLELLTDMLFDSQELSRYVNGRSVTPLTYEQAAAKAKEILADDSWKAPGFQKIGARWDKEAEVREADKQEAKSLFGDDILNLWDQFTALPKGDARRIFKAQHPQLYDYENFLEKKGYFDSDTPETPALPTTPEEIMAYLASLAAGTGAAGGTDNGQAFRPGAIESMTPAQRTEAQRQFGKDILILATQYSLLPKDSQERRDFIAEHPELSGYWDYLEEIGIYEARTGGGTGTPGTWARMSPEQRTEAQERFGEDIDTLARQYGKLPKGSQARKDFLKAHPQLSDYWDYLEEIGIYEAKVDSGYAQRSGEGYDSLGHRAYGSFAMGGGGGWGWGGGGGSWADLPQAQYVDTDFRSWEPPRRSNSREGYVRRNTDTWKLSDIPLKQLRMWR